MNELKGINVSSTIVPFTDIDRYPTHLAEHGKGGFRTVQNIADLASIFTERLEEGMLVYVVNDDSGIHTYQYLDGEWNGCKLGGGVSKAADLEEALTLPLNDGDLVYVEDKGSVYLKTNGTINPINSNGVQIYTQSQISELSAKGALPEQYIGIPDPDDIQTEAPYYEVPIQEGGTAAYTKTGNGGYVAILFSALRELQAKVAKMENTFKYGLYSYTGSYTAMGAVEKDLEDYDADEPLWAIDENELSEITNASVVFNVNTNLKPIGNLSFNVEGTEADILDTVHWTDTDEYVSSSEDAKLFVYMTATTHDQIITLKSIPSTEGEEVQTVTIDMSKFNLPSESRYNVCLCISRTYIDESTEEKTEYGYNSAWISIAGYDTAETIMEGYLIIDETGHVTTEYVYSDVRDIHKRYYFYDIELPKTTLYKLKFYSKYQDFSKEVTPAKPTDQDYRYKVAHITIRSVENSTELESIKSYLPKNELIFRESDNTLWIKLESGSVVQISGSGSGGGTDPEDTGMTETEIVALLVRMGIVSGKVVTKKDDNDKDVKYYSELSINSIADLTLIHQRSGKSFNVTVDDEGNLRTKELSTSGTTIAEIIEANKTSTDYAMSTDDGVRGLAARYFSICSSSKIKALQAKDIKLNSDRVKIGSFYAPLSTDTVFGCSHAYIELENTSDKDFPLDGCYIHFLRHNPKTQALEVLHHELSGTLKAGSTYLIRGKQYSDPETSENCFINVDDYDDLWYEGDTGTDLIDFTINKSAVSGTITGAYAFALTYGQSDLDYTTSLVSANSGSDTYPKATYEYMWKWYYIDSLVINSVTNKTSPTWSPTSTCISANSNTLVKNTFELDPAKQAFQALNMADSSRERGAKYGTDIQYVSLANEFITFPNSTEAYPVKNYTPRSSKYGKNVSTDKTKLDLEKPNMLTCSFGMNSFTTRCFNWISAGSYDEYIWLKDPSTGSWTAYQSYTTLTSPATQGTSYPHRKEYSLTLNNSYYARIYSYFPGCGTYFTSHKCVLDVVETAVTEPTTYTYRAGRRKLDTTTGKYVIDDDHASEEYTFTLYPESYIPKLYQTTDQQGFHWIEYQVWSAAAIKLNKKINSDCEGKSVVPVLLNTGDMTQNGTRINEWLDYYTGGLPLFKHLEQTNCVGNNDLCGTVTTQLGTGDDTGKSNSYYFQLFYCYDAFDYHDSSVTGTAMTRSITTANLATGTANVEVTEDNLVKLADGSFDVDSTTGKYKITPEYISANLHYYVSSDAYAVTKTDVYTFTFVQYKTSSDMYAIKSSYVLPENQISAEAYPVSKDSGTGVFTYNYIGSDLYHIQPLLKGSDNIYRAVPSLYYVDFKNYRIVMINSEITSTNAIGWFKKSVNYATETGTSTFAINPYTGWELLDNPETTADPNITDTTKYHGDFVSIYTMLYTIFNEANTSSKKCIPCCHEMPFTVITKSELSTTDTDCPKRYRSINAKGSLVGSHLNQLASNDVASVYWFSRLLEYFGITLCLGGHKHTYTCTYPCQENYIWFEVTDTSKSTPKYSYNTRMPMEKTLENDNWRCRWFDADGKNLTKLPLLNQKPEGIDYKEEELTGLFLPYDSNEAHTAWRSSYTGVLYFMCQATGYKLTSNKELPTIYQAFSQLIPKTAHKDSGDSADSSQTYPMFSITEFTETGTGTVTRTASVYLARIDNIMKSGKFTQSTFLTGKPYLHWAKEVASSRFCTWTNVNGSESVEDDSGIRVSIVSTVL